MLSPVLLEGYGSCRVGMDLAPTPVREMLYSLGGSMLVRERLSGVRHVDQSVTPDLLALTPQVRSASYPY